MTGLIQAEVDWMDAPARKRSRSVQKAERKREKTALERALKKLKAPERKLLECIVSTACMKDAYTKFFETTGLTIKRETLWRWRQKPDFQKAIELAYQFVCELHGVSRSSLIHRLEQIRDQAMTPTPILYKGEPTGFEEWQPAPALKAVETQAKLLGLYQEEKSNVAVDLHIDFGAYGDTIEGEVVNQQ